MKYALYPGCAGEATTEESLKATIKILEVLGVDFEENEAFSCCGAGIVEEEDAEFELALNARNFALAEQDGRDIVTICNTCLMTMLKSQKALADDAKLFEQVNEDLKEIGLEYKGTVKIKHFLWMLRDDIGLEKIESLIKTKIKDVRMAPFYGCHIIRPADVISDDKEPDFISKLIKVCGALPVEYRDKYNCCGFHILLADEDTSLKMTQKCLTNAHEDEADMLVTPCTLCHISLDCYQGRANKAKLPEVPVLHLGQLLGLAMGITADELGLDKNVISTEQLINY
ncbi:MAG: CoB--CoM heterodisulfide reductase iron-sulfur subunit B family protein [Bacteriovoracaceae bacterium]|nr:CoB--CoM heterodisulfide reductase iron-sulfur subunit B family protein [Bacteriovoracaceae bacterium]